MAYRASVASQWCKSYVRDAIKSAVGEIVGQFPAIHYTPQRMTLFQQSIEVFERGFEPVLCRIGDLRPKRGYIL